jgi:hypothetical protein
MPLVHATPTLPRSTPARERSLRSAIGALARPPRGATWRSPWSVLVALLALVGAVNFVVLLAQAPALVHSLYLNADNATSFVLPALAGHAPAGSVVNLGDHPWYEPWWYMRATAGLPGYRQLWEAAPFVSGLLGIAAVSACTWCALGRLAALICAVVLLAASEVLRGLLYTPETHGLIVVHLGVLCGSLLLVHRWSRAGSPPLARLLLLGVPLALFTGAGFTDQLLLVSGLGPFVLAPLACWLRLGSRAWRTVSAFALATALLSGLLALLLAHAMQEQHVVHAPFPIDFVGPEAMLTGLQNLIVAFTALGGGSFFGAPVSGTNLLTFAAGALALLALAAILRALWRWGGVSTQEAPPRALAPTHARAAGSSQDDVSSRELFVAFWGLALVFVLAAFALTQLSASSSNSRYLLGAWVAVAALLGILATHRIARIALVLAVALFGALNIRAELAAGVPAFGSAPNQKLAGEIERFALAHGARVGYGGYWDSAPVMWETHFAIKLFPIQACGFPSGWCQFYNAYISDWYVPRAHTRTFLLTDTRPGIPLEVTAPPASFGHPVAGESLGEGLTIYIYGSDIAAHLAP